MENFDRVAAVFQIEYSTVATRGHSRAIDIPNDKNDIGYN
ncbi:hypothetical protein Solca_3068 [Solitalea canadensis DSM 3403]|uniref:Uncharacterized protein n=1 Tax=Solitalea canadensis (strain ATCC 29591 / DSM 3403 / JCM 21819 / LMG 8368 / NBRC 15130 / NCIMB 12057 / USAM 9D) TaxID=929556 RepID=H8KWG7_SOLCM|nr:hypothetical protein Solca_3068 [Solitalea canadensis DSM 3403]